MNMYLQRPVAIHINIDCSKQSRLNTENYEQQTVATRHGFSYLQGEAAALWDNACAKAAVVAVDKRARVPGTIDHREVHSVGRRHRRAVHRVGCGRHVNEGPACGSIVG